MDAITIRTSGRRVFRRCPRKWGFISNLHYNLEKAGTETNPNFWFGSAIHFVMEDYFGWQRFKTPQQALKAYFDAFPGDERPGDSDYYFDLGLSMLDYFLKWYPKHNRNYGFETVWFDENNKMVEPFTKGAEPGVERSFSFELGPKVVVKDNTNEVVSIWQEGEEVPFGYKVVPVIYHGTVDRIVRDSFGRIYLWDYKTAKKADAQKLETDDQITTYMYAMQKGLGIKLSGFVYFQMTKEAPKMPVRLKNGNLSTNKRQITTRDLYKQELLNDYGDMAKVPSQYMAVLNYLAEQEDANGDRYIRWDIVTRNQQQLENERKAIDAEVKSMLQLDAYLYPNPTRDCSWDCPFRSMCIDMDRGTPIKVILENAKTDWCRRKDLDTTNHDEWRNNIVWGDNNPVVRPAKVHTLLNEDGTFNLSGK